MKEKLPGIASDDKMTDNLKSIVQAVNKCLGTDFNLISFDSQSDESLLQVLLDVFDKFDIIDSKVIDFIARVIFMKSRL